MKKYGVDSMSFDASPTPTIDECVAMFKRMGMTGWVAMDGNERWYFYAFEPHRYEMMSGWCTTVGFGVAFTAQPVADWTQSKRRVE